MGLYHWVGWLKDKFGKPVNQYVVVQKLDDKGTSYQVIKEVFFADGQMFDRPKKRKAVALSVRHTLLRRKARNIQFVDVETGSSLNFNGENTVAFSPEVLDALLTSDDVSAVSKGALGINMMSWLFLALGLMIGLFVGVLVFPSLLSALGISWW